MKNKKLFLFRIMLFLIGIFISSFGVALSSKCNLGVTPISSPPYVLSLIFPITMGNITILMHFVFIISQILLLRKKYKPKDLLQIPLALTYGKVMDLSLWILKDLSPSHYMSRLGICILSMFVIAFGVYLTVRADIMFLAGEGLISAITKISGKEFGKIKIAFDSSLLLIAVVISLISFHKLEGIREGTFISAFAVGMLVQIYSKIFSTVKIKTQFQKIELPEGQSHLVVTIAREFDPRAAVIIKRLSEITGLKLYDEELVPMVAQESGLPIEKVQRREDGFRRGIMQYIYDYGFNYPYRHRGDDEDRVFQAQQSVIRRLAKTEDCIIAGRIANKILGRGPTFFHIFLHAKPQKRVEETAKEFNISESQAESIINYADKQRREIHLLHLGHEWGMACDYNLCLDITHCDIEKTAAFLKKAIEDFTWRGTGEEIKPMEDDVVSQTP